MAQVSARRATVQERKARRQFVLALLAAVAIGLTFVFVVMPLLFSFVVSLARRGSPIQEQGDIVPPQRPVLQPVLPFQNKTELEITGFTEPGAQVSLYLDFAEHSVVVADDEGAFTFPLQLEEGEHEFWLIAADDAGNLSSESTHYPVTVDLTAPTLEITQPENGARFTLPRERVVTVTGKVSEKARVMVAGSLVTTNDEGNFSTTLQLAEGPNEIVILATDEAGNQSEEKKISVEYRP